MRLWQWLRTTRFQVVSLLMLALLILPVLSISAQMDPEETPESAWGTNDTAAADAAPSNAAPLTLVWQTEFTPDAMLLSPGDIAIDGDGNIYVSTQSANTIKKFDADGNFMLKWGASGDDEGEFTLALGMAVDSEGNVYVTDFYNRRIQKFDGEGAFLKAWDTDESTSPAFLAIDSDDNIYLDLFPPHDEHYVQIFDTEGSLLSEWGADNDRFGGRLEDIAVDPDGNFYAADVGKHRIQKVDPEGNVLASFGDGINDEGNGKFDSPFGLTVDGDGYVYVLDRHFLQKLDSDGNFIAQWSTKGGDLDRAANVAADADGNLYVFAYADVTSANGNEANVLVLKKFEQRAW
jgi:sugar lactone lactonase YvrE